MIFMICSRISGSTGYLPSREGGVRAAEVDLLATSVDIRLDLKKEILDDVCVFELSAC
jgi:hypothetical protein